VNRVHLGLLPTSLRYDDRTDDRRGAIRTATGERASLR